MQTSDTFRDTDTAHYIMALHHWWGKEYADHKGHLQQKTEQRVDELETKARVDTVYVKVGMDSTKVDTMKPALSDSLKVKGEEQ